MDRKIRVNQWRNTTSTNWKESNVDWSVLKEILLEKIFHDDKDSGMLFNGGIYRDVDDSDAEWNTRADGTRYLSRGINNVVALDLLLLDYDNNPPNPPSYKNEICGITTVPKDLVLQMLDGYEFVMYPTHSDLRTVWVAVENKIGDLVWTKKVVPYGNGIERFRVVIPFASSCAKKEFEAIVRANGFDAIVPRANMESFTPTQFFYEPRYPLETTPNPCSGSGKLLDWTSLDKKYEEEKIYVPPTIVGKVEKGGKGRILLNTLDIKQFCSAMGLQLGRGTSWIPVTCPWESEHTSDGGTHIKSGPSGWGFSCKHTSHGKKGNKEFIEHYAKIYGWNVFRPYCDCEDVPDKVEDLIKKASNQKKLDNELIDSIMDGTVNIEFVGDDNKVYTLEQVRSKLNEIEIKGVTCVCGEEGLGKTYIVVLLASKGTKFILCCKSNEQAAKKAEELNSLGLCVKNIRSKEYKFKLTYGIGFERHEPTDPYTVGAIDLPRTLESLMQISGMTKEEAILAYEEIQPDRFPRFDKDALLPWNKDHPLRKELKTVDGWVTTYAQLKGLLDSYNKPFRFITIIVDDPDVEDVSILRPYHQRYQTARDNHMFDVVTIDGKEYCKIDRRELLCHSIENNVMFTTTELCTQHVINYNYNNVNNYNFFRDVKIDTGNVFFIKSTVTQKDYHYIFHMYKKVLEENKIDVNIIADGISMDLNLSNSKGRNDLKSTNSIIKISRPHPDRVRWLCAELGVPYKKWRGKFYNNTDCGEQYALDEALMLDVMNQAIGRNSGNRYNGKEAVVFIPNSMFGTLLLQDSRYMMRDCSVRDKGFAKTVWDNIGKPEHMFVRDDFVNVILRSCLRGGNIAVRDKILESCLKMVDVCKLSKQTKLYIKERCKILGEDEITS